MGNGAVPDIPNSGLALITAASTYVLYSVRGISYSLLPNNPTILYTFAKVGCYFLLLEFRKQQLLIPSIDLRIVLTHESTEIRRFFRR